MTGPSPQPWFTSPKTQGGCHFHPLHSGYHRHPHNYHHNHSADSFHEHINEDDNELVRKINQTTSLCLLITIHIVIYLDVFIIQKAKQYD